MKQAWHIFRKDVRYLRWEIALNLAIIAAFCAADSVSQSHVDRPTTIFKGLIPFSIMYLVVRAVQQEPLMGDRQFWITRPYRWASLLAAKLTFFFVFISIPMAASDAIILQTQGFPVISNAPGIAWEMALRFAYFVLLPMALATLTRTPAAFWLACVATLVLIGLYANVSYRYDLYWPLILTGTLLIPLVVGFQYRRRTVFALGSAVCAIVFCVAAIGEPAKRPFEPKVLKNPAVRVELDGRPERKTPPLWSSDASAKMLALPLVIQNRPDGLRLRAGKAEARLSRPNSERTWALERTKAELSVEFDPSRLWLEVPVSQDFYNKAAGAKVDIDCVADLILYPVPTAVEEGRFPVPGVGFCHYNPREPTIWCMSALRRPQVTLYVDPGSGYMGFPRSPFPAELGISPIAVFTLGGNNIKAITAAEPVLVSPGYLKFGGIRLDDYMEKRSQEQ